MRNQTKILSLCIGFLVGIVFSANFLFDINIILISFLAFLVFISCFLVKSRLVIILIAILGFSIGLIRYDFYSTTHPRNELKDLEMTKQSISGRVIGDVYRDQYGNNNFVLDQIKIEEKSYSTQIKVKTINGAVQEGQRVLVSGKVKPSVGKLEQQISFAKVEIIDPKQPMIIRLKTVFVFGIKRSIAEPASSFLIGILIGARSTLPKNLQDYLSSTGLAHIVAVSGYNLTIITGFLDRILKGKWKWGSLVLSLWLMLGFVLITGASASIVRAAIMSSIFIIVRFYGKKISILSALSLTAIITCAFNPSYIISDLGWQLSFLSLGGIVLFAPKVERILPKKMPYFIKEIISVSLSAQIATFPLIAYKFGQISFIAPLANILIMPLIPFLMLLGFVAGVLGSIFSSNIVATIFFPLSKLLELVIDLIRYLASFKFSSIKIPTPNILLIVLAYIILIVLASIRTKKPSKNT